MTHLGMLRRRKVRTIIDIILVMMTINMMMVIIRMMMTIILLPPGQMHFFPSRLGLGLLEPAEAEFEVLFITILPHFSNITLSLLFIFTLSLLFLGVVQILRNRGWGGGSPNDYSIA